jgi:delta-1-pyrroline-5-carboxylate synthetase
MWQVGSAVVTREDECGLALGRLAALVEQIAELHAQDREVMLITSGAVAFGKQLLHHQANLTRTIRQTISRGKAAMPLQIDPRACSATGQGGLTALYDSMFSQYGITTAQVLVTKSDFTDRETVQYLGETLNALLAMKVVPIINENDAVSPPARVGADLEGVMSVTDNDSLAANIAARLGADLLVLMTDVEGIYNAPPSEGGKLLERYCPELADNIVFGTGSKVCGLSKIKK